ncbi:MAG: UDP-N-acetylenolpyruvoylglucosamine reductase [Microgenomates group bacterium GW2011_GWF2_45_18]|nr:MAG: UDP-N-acetylenolpyruvoylglucosamine reductase [Microgenomates group bacterium GW2011_GWF1_44_10]KKU02357.1 MAG: UDP-N-acetylenolpyruvoylglucosamine reductase [Microgenomates group bacterium GW2011_GWF2_45_18]OGJ41689.1 MAG: UDP-N-acetylenolpyruvoylglucosamine reductase [Candidatus Pacebacteria bacterium RIFOXYB1_FULL_44_10]HAU99176.1 UDP-N-acetylenolpyruvoylglucosamine reductase [Candidatus Paceibacterota bacterium]HAX01706.1 UDP-N-acetylenolpyruvoylglucosamine reductase [Candidatus Pac
MQANQWLTLLQSKLPHLNFLEGELLSKHTYFRIGGPARIFCAVDRRNDLELLAKIAYENIIPFHVFGGASNVLIRDEGVDALVILNKTKELLVEESADDVRFIADSGLPVNILVKSTIDHSATGMQCFLGLPGTVGGAVVNNSHFTSTQLFGNFIEYVDVVTPAGTQRFFQKDLEFAYDYSRFHHERAVVLRASFRVLKGNLEEIRAESLQYVQKRNATQPIGLPSSGCIFRNALVADKKVFAGKLIDDAGLKGTRVGGAEVSEVHANFIVNRGGASSHDVLELAELVQKKVKDKTGVVLEKEIFIIP